jgi:hypothetical protein
MEVARARAIDEALKVSGARSLAELLADHEKQQENHEKLCA